jgi:hypothetical protein
MVEKTAAQMLLRSDGVTRYTLTSYLCGIFSSDSNLFLSSQIRKISVVLYEFVEQELSRGDQAHVSRPGEDRETSHVRDHPPEEPPQQP